jgi:hypothetical protein
MDSPGDFLSESDLDKREAIWAMESERRIDAFDTGKITARDAGDVLDDLKSGLLE